MVIFNENAKARIPGQLSAPNQHANCVHEMGLIIYVHNKHASLMQFVHRV